MQGRYINRQALKALGGHERITMITSFRPKCPLAKDESVLTGVRGISGLNDLYSDFTIYRLGILEEHIRDRLTKEKQQVLEAKSFETQDLKECLAEQKRYLEATIAELIE